MSSIVLCFPLFKFRDGATTTSLTFITIDVCVHSIFKKKIQINDAIFTRKKKNSQNMKGQK